MPWKNMDIINDQWLNDLLWNNTVCVNIYDLKNGIKVLTQLKVISLLMHGDPIAKIL